MIDPVAPHDWYSWKIEHEAYRNRFRMHYLL